MTDEEFSRQIAGHFEKRLMSSGQVQPSPTVRKRQPTAKGALRRGGKGRKEDESERETSSLSGEGGDSVGEGEERVRETV